MARMAELVYEPIYICLLQQRLSTVKLFFVVSLIHLENIALSIRGIGHENSMQLIKWSNLIE